MAVACTPNSTSQPPSNETAHATAITRCTTIDHTRRSGGVL
jgi:hypothetical protein